MDAKEIRSLLKQAREAIREKDFKSALKHCRCVLETDNNNYNAYVFVGVAAQELDEPEKTIAAYKRAIEIAPDQLLAWQGLCNYYEKSGNDEQKKELLNVYMKLMKLYAEDKNKLFEVTQKISKIYKFLGEYEIYVKTIHKCLQLAEGNISEEYLIYQTLIDEFSDVTTLSNDHKKLLETAYCALLSKPETSKEDHVELYRKYLVFLYKCGLNEKVIQTCEMLSSIYPESLVPLEFICQISVEKYALEGVILNELSAAATHLKELNSNSGLGNLAYSIVLLSKGDISNALNELVTGLEQLPASQEGWLILAQIHLKLHKFQDAKLASCEGVKISKSVGLNVKLNGLLNLCLGKALIGLKIWDVALEALEKSSVKLGRTPEVLEAICISYINTEDFQKAKEICNELKVKDDSSCEVILHLEGYIYFSEKQYAEAEERLLQANMQKETSFSSYLLGLIYWQTNRYEEAFKLFVKSIKLDPYISRNYLYLGHYYKLQNNFNKAKQCYRKAFELDRDDEEIGKSYSDILYKLGDKGTNLFVLKLITEQALKSGRNNKWAWTQLGLCYLSHGSPSSAVIAFQNALRIDPNDSHNLQCLGDAYYQRGSYTAALKAFTMASEIDPKDLYPLYQKATIQKITGYYVEAVEGYRNILLIEPSYAPALKGLAEAQLSHAQSCLSQGRFGTVKDCYEEVLDILSRAVSFNPNLSCLWKMMGDACTLSTYLGPDYFPFNVPSKLILKPSNSDIVQCNKLEVLKLGSRLYVQAISVLPEVSGLWYDLGVNYYHQSLISSEASFQKETAQKALLCMKKSVCLEPLCYRFWNGLGIVASTKEIQECDLAQHAFITSLKIEANNPAAWTNLGVLYLVNKDILLANKAFSAAQSVDPTYPFSWIGQALLAEHVGNVETVELFHHAVSLSIHPQGLIGYGHWTCKSLQNSKCNGKDMDAISLATECLIKYTAIINTSAEAYIMLGILLEQQNLFIGAAAAYQKAVELLEKEGLYDCLDKAHINYARVLSYQGQQNTSIQQYMQVKKVDVSVLCSLALSFYSDKQLQQAFKVYQQASQKSDDSEEKSHILVAMAIIARKLQGADAAKSLLFQSSQHKPSSIQGLLALCALGLLQKDFKLSGAALKELLPHKNHPLYGAAVVFFITCHLFYQSKLPAARNILLRAVHDHPYSSDLWSSLCTYMLSWKLDNPKMAVICAQRAQFHIQDKPLASLLLSLTSLEAGYPCTALRSSQKALHLSPDKVINWSSLLCACYGTNIHVDVIKKLLLLVKKIVKLDRPVKPELLCWLVILEILYHLQTQNTAVAEQLIQSASKALASNQDTAYNIHLLQAVTNVCSSYENNNFMNDVFAIVQKNPSQLLGWQTLFKLHLNVGKVAESHKILNHFLQSAGATVSSNLKQVLQIQLALLAYQNLKTTDEKEKWKKICQEALSSVLEKDAKNQSAWFLQSLIAQEGNNSGLFKKCLKRVISTSNSTNPKNIDLIARKILLEKYMGCGDNIEDLLAEFSTDKLLFKINQEIL